MSNYGKQVILDFVPKLVEQGITIISGLAEGVDHQAQTVALKCGGSSVGVLGFGIMRVGNFSNKDLCKQVVYSKRGFLVSPFIDYQTASKQTFLERNCVIAALADAVLVVEATTQSGCISTVESALDMGKEVYVVPGSVFSYTSMGTNNLIKQGAHLCNNIHDIFI